jgi:[acyl-carrier-protein] S-malonyltransferase
MATRIVCVFPGQGSQTVGMGKDLWEADEAVKALYQEAMRKWHDPALCFEGQRMSCV